MPIFATKNPSPWRTRSSPALTILCLLLAGCATSYHGPAESSVTEPPLPTPRSIQAEADSLPYLEQSEFLEIGPGFPEETLLSALAQTDYDSLNQVFDAALAAAGDQRWEQTRDHLFALEEQLRLRQDIPDTLVEQARLSLQRRIALLRAIEVETGAFSGGSDPDLMLAQGYQELDGALPDSLRPAVGDPIPGIMADLLHWDNPRVEHWIQYFTGTGRRTFALWLQRKQEVGDMMTSILKEEGIPEELIYLAMIESGFSARARSEVAAVGPWQFMAPTAKGLGLRINWWVDERCDYVRSTHAAARHLRSLHDTFGDWSLVLAAYNAGQNRVLRKIHQRATDNYWDLNLPAQTADFVPKFIAAARIGAAPADYGFAADSITSPLVFDTIEVTQPTGLDLLAECASATTAELRNLNPALKRGATPPDLGAYPVHVPASSAGRVKKALAKIPADRRLTWTRHRVRRGETLGGIAQRYGCSVADIARVNHLDNVRLIHPDDQLVIPMPGDLDRLARSRAGEKGHYVPPSGYKQVTYKVRPGDTLSGIAHRLGVTVTHLRKVNNIHRTSLIHPGDRLFAYRPAG